MNLDLGISNRFMKMLFVMSWTSSEYLIKGRLIWMFVIRMSFLSEDFGRIY